MMKTLIAIVSMVMVMAGQPVLAAELEADQIRGEVVNVNDNDRKIAVRVEAVGAAMNARIGEVETYGLTDDTEVSWEVDRMVYGPFTDYDFDDINMGDTVVLDFTDPAYRTVLERMRNIEPQDTIVRQRVTDRAATEDRYAAADQGMNQDQNENRYASNDTDNRRSALPDSASNLPLYAVIGLMFAVLAGAVRIYRS